MYIVFVTNTAKKELKTISLRHKSAIISALKELQENPLLGKPLKRDLTGKYSYRIGVYRIIYMVNKKDKHVYVLAAGHRAVVYD